MTSKKTAVGLKLIQGTLKNLTKKDLNLRPCLKGGMSFRWQQYSPDDENKFLGIIKNRVYILNQSETSIDYSVYYNEKDNINGEINEMEIRNELFNYFRLNEDLDQLYAKWSARDEKFKARLKQYPEDLCGIRSLRLDPVENLFSFICSSNNNIKRITQMIHNMCLHFGKLIGNLDAVDYYEFPLVERLCEKDVEQKLRELNFGYRAKFIYQAAEYLCKNHNNPREHLYLLRQQPYDLVHSELVKIPGIGNKVADCICLMSLDKLEAIPVDTHVLSIAVKNYGFNYDQKAKSSNLTDKNYKLIADKFRELWGEKAGWAQTIMFIDDLKNFKAENISSQQTLSEASKSKKRASSPNSKIEEKVKQIKQEDKEIAIDCDKLVTSSKKLKKESAIDQIDQTRKLKKKSK